MASGPDTTPASSPDGSRERTAKPAAPRSAPEGVSAAPAEPQPAEESATAPAEEHAARSDVPPDSEGPGRPERPGRLRRLAALARREWRRTALAALSGVALALAFPPYDLWPLSLVAVAALSLLTRGRTGRQGAWSGLAFGWPFFLVLLKWLHVVGWDAVIGLAFLQGLFVLGLGAGLALTSRLPAWPLWGACLWVTEEFLRDRLPFGGFPWGRLAFANTGSPFTPLAALGGAPLVTFAVALTGTLLAATALTAWRLRRAPARAARTPRAYVTGLGALALAAAVTLAGFAVPVPTQAADTARIAVVQGNVQQPGMDFLGRPMQILNNHVEATLDLAERIKQGKEPKPDLVIWPENSSDLDPYTYPEAGDRIDEAVKAVGVPVLVGALVDHPTKQGYVENQGIVWDPEKGPGASYTKQHPVPFGEYVPFRDQLSKVITRLQQIPRDFYPGDHTGVLQTGPARLGDVICFEVAYDEIPRDTVKDGARALVVQTNNATYGNTGQPEQQLVMSKLRAIEHGRAVVTAATSGISAIVAPDGTVTQRTQEFTQDVLTGTLPLRDDLTVADRVGAAPEWAIAIVGVLACAGAWLLGRRKRGARAGAAPTTAAAGADGQGEAPQGTDHDQHDRQAQTEGQHQ
ncbi:apolipoprotein N-acyltransferase [Streptomyces diacarni]|uniref:Apolipoprotein N-acyltransferase n=1 Tax=Streptomyces diacarni TaxID=2800381 RepID=A0A367EHY6_9ACTN|nr:apolipoprotein N-acyltransferase [Streptomyces diacarni]RCG17342.1 apolipoprotein N-acyltransferase [Streptomyces diacarni]